MTMDAIGGYVTLAIAVVAFLGTAAVFLRGSADKGTITSLKEALGALKEEMAASDLTHKRELGMRDLKIKSQGDKIDELQGQVTGLGRELNFWRNAQNAKEEIARLQETLDAHHNEAREHWERIEEAVTR